MYPFLLKFVINLEYRETSQISEESSRINKNYLLVGCD